MVTFKSGHLHIPAGESWLDELFSTVLERHPQRLPLKLDNVPVDSHLYDYLFSSQFIRNSFIVYQVPWAKRIQTITLEPSYDQFLARYSSKKRYNLRRQFRLLETKAGGGIALRRCESTADVPAFFEAYRELYESGNRIQYGTRRWKMAPELRSEMELTSRHGLMLGYLLMAKERPVSCAYGWRLGKVYMLIRTIFDPEYEDVSPGTALLQLMIEDLIKEKRTTLINLGYGHPDAEFRATNVIHEYASYWLFPRTWKTRLFRAGYRALRHGVGWLKGSQQQPEKVRSDDGEDG
jgi:hypothetical protein